MTQDNTRPDIIDLLALHREQRNAVPAQRARRIDLAQIRARLAATDPRQVDQMVEGIEKIRLGLEAFDLAQEYLAAGTLDRARHWLTVAAEYDIEDADTLLADVTAIQDALDSPQTTAITTGTALDCDGSAAEKERRADVIDELHEAGAVLRRAREQAQAMVRKAQTTAGEILAEARSETLPFASVQAALQYWRNRAAHERETDLLPLLLPRVETCHDAGAVPSAVQRAVQRVLQRVLFQHLGNHLHGYSADLETVRAALRDWRIHQRMKPLAGGEDKPDNLMLLTINYDRKLEEANAVSEALWARQAALLRYRSSGTGMTGDFQTALDNGECEAIRVLANVASTARDCMRERDYWSVLAAPSLWTPSEWTRDLAPSTEQQLEREQIVPGPKFREALDELNEQLAAAGA